MRHFIQLAIASGVVLSFASPASAFTEDICYTSSGGVAECTPLPTVCQPAGTDSVACRDAAIATFAEAAATYTAMRSSIHVDATFILAQAAGFSFNDAYWIAAYSETTDQGQFVPLDNTGAVVGGTMYQTASMNGLERTDFTPSGGIYIHFAAPYNPNGASAVPGINGLDPNPSDAIHEVMLSNLRTWALASGSSAPFFCATGLTSLSTSDTSYSTGSSCFTAPGGAPATVNGSVTMFDGAAMAGSMDTQYWSISTGAQIIQNTDAGVPVSTSTSFDTLAGVNAANARLGVYIHAFGDRISHHVCLDQSYLTGPADGGTEWTANMTNDQCAQGIHLLRHIWEHGVEFSLLDAADQTTSAYFGQALTELAPFAAARPGTTPNATYAPGSAGATKLASDLSAAIQIPTAAARLAALNQITCARGFTPFPGQTPCSSSSSSSGSSTSSSSSGSAASGSSSTVSGSTTSSSTSGSSGAPKVAADDTSSKGCALSGDAGNAFGAGSVFLAAVTAMRLGRRRRVSRRARLSRRAGP